MTLRGRDIVITGSSRGLGLALARACVEQGAHVLICARGSRQLERARRELASRVVRGQQVFACRCDVSEPRDARRLVRFAVRALPALHGLVNNAAVQGPIGLTEDLCVADWIAALRVNLLGTVLPCHYLVAQFRTRGYGKIVNLSGGGAASPRPRFSAYASAKAAVVRFTETLAAETRGSGIDVNAVAPGALNTRLLEQILRAGPAAAGRQAYADALRQKRQASDSLARAVALCVFLLSPASDGISGRLLSALWDPWKTLGQRRAALEESDVYTLRRILPRDRGMNWGCPARTGERERGRAAARGLRARA